ncbi:MULTISPECIES: acyl-CoA dehydrogenase [unclassified Rhodococcus (in: high G+C Gram-positive bacteria)]|uniref:acyl-CoA dehydrogenase n=1 Tax=unclassified Rhodococcus (in: high G+C Gram-positive bacteria) TaxID=192944 RepID=UPI0033977274
MPIALTEDQLSLAESINDYYRRTDALGQTRARLESPTVGLPGDWARYAELGWLGIHLPEDVGGAGMGMGEAAVVVEELAAVLAPGPVLPTVWASALLAASGTPDQQQQLSLTGLAEGTVVGAVGSVPDGLASRDADGAFRLAGPVQVLGGMEADLILLTVGADVLAFDRVQLGSVDAESMDPTRSVALISADGPVQPRMELPGAAELAQAIGRVLAAAEATGVTRACQNMAVDYAKQRQAFGRAIGSFQAIKHILANVLVDQQLSMAQAWDAAGILAGAPEQRSLAAAAAVVTALPAAVSAAEQNVQVHGAIGYTREHDAHLYMRRAGVLSMMFSVVAARREIAAATVAGVRRVSGIDLPPEAEGYRAQAREFVAQLGSVAGAERRELFVDSGYAIAHWPRPWGLGAGAVEQLVLDEELRGQERPEYGIGEWVLRTVVDHGTQEQLDRYVHASLLGKITWCQLFSEPGAGSDAAGVTTKAKRAEGGWIVNGQKTWTSGGHTSTHGMATIRTNPDAAKHKGISMMLIDMAAPGLTVRPIQDSRGVELFAEVFFDDVFVADEDVLGAVDGGWGVARSALGNERVTIGRDRLGLDLSYDLFALYAEVRGDAGLDQSIADLVAEDLALAALTRRIAEQAVRGGASGPEGAVLKLVGSEHTQRLATVSLAVAGEAGALEAKALNELQRSFLYARYSTLAGGTSEVLRNQIAELILGLPREQSLR